MNCRQSEAAEEVKTLRRDGLRAVDQNSRPDFGKDFRESTAEQQTALLTEISRNERCPTTLAERLFRTIKT